MKKLFALMLCLALVLSCAAGLAESDKDAVVAKGKLVVGITDFAPMDYRDTDGSWVGFDADVARCFAATLGIEAEFVEIDWDNKVLELNSGNIDCVWNGMTLTDEVLAAMNCSNPYANNAQIVIVPAEIPARVAAAILLLIPIKPEDVPITIGSFPPMGPRGYSWSRVTTPAMNIAFCKRETRRSPNPAPAVIEQTPMMISRGERLPTNMASTCCRPRGTAWASGILPFSS